MLLSAVEGQVCAGQFGPSVGPYLPTTAKAAAFLWRPMLLAMETSCRRELMRQRRRTRFGSSQTRMGDSASDS